MHRLDKPLCASLVPLRNPREVMEQARSKMKASILKKKKKKKEEMWEGGG